MIPKTLFLAGILLFPAVHSYGQVDFPLAAEESETVMTINFDKPEDAARKMPKGFIIRAGEGWTGSSALCYERNDPGDYPLFSIPLTDLTPGTTYIVKARVRGEGLKHVSGERNKPEVICIEYKVNGVWAGGIYGVNMPGAGGDWQDVSINFKAQEETQLVLYMGKRFTGKLWFDEVEIRSLASAPAYLITRPDRLSFFGGKGDFVLHTDRKLAENQRLFVKAENAGKTQDIVLKQKDADYEGKIRGLRPGKVEITVRIADMERKVIVSEQKFLLTAYPATKPPKSACRIDEYNRAVIDGKPFMPLGVFGYADETGYKRLQEAGFNCVQMYRSLGLKGDVDHKDPVRNMKEGLDLLDKYGLKMIYSLKNQHPHVKKHVLKWGDAEGLDAVNELIVKTGKDHPALLAWYVSDEAHRQYIPELVHLRQTISQTDPWHPTWTLTNNAGDFPDYGLLGDVVGIDPYVISYSNTEQSIKSIKAAMISAMKAGTPVWIVPQINNPAIWYNKENFKNTHFPTLEELRAMPLYAAICGAKGFIFYSYFDIWLHYDKLGGYGTAAREWAKVVEMVKPLRELEPFIMSKRRQLPLHVECDRKDAVEASAMFDDKGNFRIVIIGTGGNAQATIILPKALQERKAVLRSKYGKTRPIGDGRYQFSAGGVDSDILE